MPRKQWGTFEKVNAADVNGFLADQSVMTFATTAARDAALPSPTVGMQSAVQASPDLGAPRYWDGSAWTLVRNGATTPAVWSKLNPTNDAGGYFARSSAWTGGNWNQVFPSQTYDAVVYAVWLANGAGYQLGTGASGSEVVRGYFGSSTSVVPYGVFVPAGTRLAIRPDSGSVDTVVQWSATTQPLAQWQGGNVAGVTAPSATWVEVATSPPLAGGVWVIGAVASFSGLNQQFQFALGASGSEVICSNFEDALTSSAGTLYQVLFSPFWWPSSTRLAVRGNFTGRNITVSALWRESLT